MLAIAMANIWEKLHRRYLRWTTPIWGEIPAQGYWSSAGEYYQNYRGVLPDLEYQIYYPAHELIYPLPRTIHPEVHPCFQQRTRIPIPETYWLTVPGGTILRAHHSMGSVIAHDGRVIHDISRQFIFPAEKNEALYLRFPKVQSTNSCIAVTTDGGGAGGCNYWHWLTDIVPRVYLLQQQKIHSKINYFLIDKPPKQLEVALDILGIDRQKIVYPRFNYSLRSPLVVVPGYIRERPKWILDCLRKLFLPHGETCLTGYKKLYISRSKARRRRIVNEYEVLDYLVSRGYTPCWLEDLSFSEQIGLFRGAKYVIGLHGAGLTNIAWCEPGGRVLEIFPDVPWRDCYWVWANQVGWDYYYWYPQIEQATAGYDADIWIDMAAFRQVVEHFES
ncbi:MAG: glycosyltransferase family 61 protein [Gloeomargarita sp. GMQP_bins_120]